MISIADYEKICDDAWNEGSSKIITLYYISRRYPLPLTINSAQPAPVIKKQGAWYAKIQNVLEVPFTDIFLNKEDCDQAIVNLVKTGADTQKKTPVKTIGNIPPGEKRPKFSPRNKPPGAN